MVLIYISMLNILKSVVIIILAKYDAPFFLLVSLPTRRDGAGC